MDHDDLFGARICLAYRAQDNSAKISVRSFRLYHQGDQRPQLPYAALIQDIIRAFDGRILDIRMVGDQRAVHGAFALPLLTAVLAFDVAVIVVLVDRHDDPGAVYNRVPGQ
jgi:hypothetical protein